MAGTSNISEILPEEGSNTNRRQVSLNDRVARLELAVDEIKNATNQNVQMFSQLMAIMGAKVGESSQQAPVQINTPVREQQEERVRAQPTQERLASVAVPNPLYSDEEDVNPSEAEIRGGQDRLARDYHGGRAQPRPRNDRGDDHRRRRNNEYDDSDDEGYLSGQSHRRGDRRQHYRQAQPAKPKMEFPTFEKGDPGEWISRAEHYFARHDLDREEWVDFASYYLLGKANQWWRWLKSTYARERRRLGWSRFTKEMVDRFGPPSLVNYEGQLAKIKQEGSLEHYLEEFERLSELVSNWPESALMATFLEGLLPWLGREVKMREPTSLAQCIRLARLVSAGRSQVREMPRPSRPIEKQWRKPSTVGPSDKRQGEPSRARLSPEEVKKRIEKGLCLRCNDKWGPNHQCKQGRSFSIIVASDEESEEAIEEQSEGDEADEVNSLEEEVIEGELTLNALKGPIKPTVMRLLATIGGREVYVLVDSGASHNFVNSKLVKKLHLQANPIEAFDVKVASGDKLRCSHVVRKAHLLVQGVEIEAELHVLNLAGLDVVLGNAWLRGVGKVTSDFNKMSMQFVLHGRECTWQALNPSEIRPCEVNEMERSYKSGAECYAVILAPSNVEKKGVRVSTLQAAVEEAIPWEVQQVLEQYQDLLTEPQGLPPQRAYDHKINLTDESKAVNVAPYRYAHFQKSEIERQVEEMLRQGIIRPSNSPFSSPVLLVRKKDGS